MDEASATKVRSITMDEAQAFQFDEWGIECPKCQGLLELGDSDSFKDQEEITCDCGHVFKIIKQ
jgi:hypothetical protein